MNRKHIVIFSTNYLPNIGGAEIAVKEITDRLPEIEFDMIVPKLHVGLPRKERIGNIFVYRLGVGIGIVDKLLVPFLGAIQAWSISRRREADVFWCIMASFGSGAAYIHNFLFFWRTVPIVLTLQEGDSPAHIQKRRGGLIALSWRMALERTQQLTVISSYLERMARQYGYGGEVEIIRNGANVEIFSRESLAARNEKVELKKGLGINEDEKVILTVSRLAVKNGVDIAIRALESVPRAKLVVVGGGELEEGLRKLARSLDLEERVIFVGSVPYDVVASYYSIADVFIRPSRSEGMGNVFVEAMAAGVPVVATRIGAIPEIVEHERTGLLCPPEDYKCMAKEIERILKDEYLRSKLVKNGRRVAKERFSWDTISESMEKTFEKVW